MRKKILLPILTFIGLGSFVVLGSSPALVARFLESTLNSPIAKIFLSKDKNESEKTISRNNGKIQNADASPNGTLIRANGTSATEVPEYILYDQMFRLIVRFKKLAEEQEAKGQQATPLHGYFEREAKLNDEQTRILQETAVGYVGEIELVDAQARVIIETIRSTIPRGQPLADKRVLEPPAELKELQKKREDLALRYRDHLRDLFGPEQFQNFQNFIQQNMKQSITAMPVDTIKPENAIDESKPFTRQRLN